MSGRQELGRTKTTVFPAAGALVGIVILVGGAYALRLTAQQADTDFKPVRLLEAQRPITSFPTKPVHEAYEALNPSESVLGVTVGSESRDMRWRALLKANT